MKVVALIDGDVIAWKAASVVQKEEEDLFGYIQPFANLMEGCACVDNMLASILRNLKADEFKVCLSDPSGSWRKELWEGYKANRKDTVRPLLLGRLLEYLRTKHGGEHWAGLEADDMLGILATAPESLPVGGVPDFTQGSIEYEKRIVCSNDKDMQTFPGFQYTLGDNRNGSANVREVWPEFAKRYHLRQTLSGDRVDGYYGCPGIGTTRAEEIIENAKALVQTKTVITRGPRKGQEVTAWKYEKEPTNDLWRVVVTHYRKAGLGANAAPEQALLTARLASILQYQDYDRATGRITLWTPDKLNG